MKIGPAGARRYYTSIVGPPAEIIKYPQTFDPRFYRGQNVPNFDPNFDTNRLWIAVFLKCGALSEIQNKLVKDQTWVGRYPQL